MALSYRLRQLSQNRPAVVQLPRGHLMAQLRPVVSGCLADLRVLPNLGYPPVLVGPEVASKNVLKWGGRVSCFGGSSLLEASDFRISKAHAETKDLLFLGVNFAGLQINT